MTTNNSTQSEFNIFAVLSIIFCWFAGILGLVFGYIALSQIKRTGQRGRGLALAGVIISWIAVGIVVIWTVVIIVAGGIYLVNQS